MVLDNVPVGTAVRICAVEWSRLVKEEALRLQALGVDIGATVAISHRGIFLGSDPIALEVGRMTIALRRDHARAITVEKI